MASKLKTLEFEPDAWERFGRFVREIVQAGPQHRKPKTMPKNKKKATRRKRKVISS
jgi:hypothetical protein